MTLRRARVLVAPLALLFLALANPARAAETSAPVKREPPPTNVRLLQEAVRAACDKLVAGAPIMPGTRVALRADQNQPLDADVAEALLQALNARRIDCVLVETAPAADATTTAPAPSGPGAANNPQANSPSTPPSGGLSEFSKLQEERAAQQAKADSIAKAAAASGAVPKMVGTGGGATSASILAGGGGTLPVVAYRVGEARVDYVRQFRGGLFGAQRMERRATATVALRMSNPGSDAVVWSASADTSVGDVVLKSDLAALEDRQRPETRPVPPVSGASKIVEPVLVVVLIAGLVSLFYQNRP